MTGTDMDPVVLEATQAVHQNPSAANPYYLRSPEQIARFFNGLELVEIPAWCPPAVATRPQRPGRLRRKR